MIINISKYCVASYSVNPIDILLDYSLNAIRISNKDSFMDLGVIFNKRRFFVSHNYSVIMEASRLSGFTIRVSRDFLESSTRQLLYFSYERYRLEYASVLWFPHYSNHIHDLEHVQPQFLKFLAFKRVSTCHY